MVYLPLGTQAQANEANEAATKATQVKAKTTSRAPRHHSPRRGTLRFRSRTKTSSTGPVCLELADSILLCNGIRPGNQGLQYTLLTPWHESAPSRHETSKASEPTEVEGPTDKISQFGTPGDGSHLGSLDTSLGRALGPLCQWHHKTTGSSLGASTPNACAAQVQGWIQAPPKHRLRSRTSPSAGPRLFQGGSIPLKWHLDHPRSMTRGSQVCPGVRLWEQAGKYPKLNHTKPRVVTHALTNRSFPWKMKVTPFSVHARRRNPTLIQKK